MPPFLVFFWCHFLYFIQLPFIQWQTPHCLLVFIYTGLQELYCKLLERDTSQVNKVMSYFNSFFFRSCFITKVIQNKRKVITKKKKKSLVQPSVGGRGKKGGNFLLGFSMQECPIGSYPNLILDGLPVSTSFHHMPCLENAS